MDGFGMRSEKIVSRAKKCLGSCCGMKEWLTKNYKILVLMVLASGCSLVYKGLFLPDAFGPWATVAMMIVSGALLISLVLYALFSMIERFMDGQEARNVSKLQMENFQKSLSKKQHVLLDRLTPENKALGEAETEIETELEILYKASSEHCGIDIKKQFKAFQQDPDFFADYRKHTFQVLHKILELVETEAQFTDNQRFSIIDIISKQVSIQKTKVKNIDGKETEQVDLQIKSRIQLVGINQSQPEPGPLFEDILSKNIEALVKEKSLVVSSMPSLKNVVHFALNRLQICHGWEAGRLGKILVTGKSKIKPEEINAAIRFKKVMSPRYDENGVVTRSTALKEIFFNDKVEQGDLLTLYLLLNHRYGGALDLELHSLESFSPNRLVNILNGFSDEDNDGEVTQLATYINMIQSITALLTLDWEEASHTASDEVAPKSDDTVAPEKEPLFKWFFEDDED